MCLPWFYVWCMVMVHGLALWLCIDHWLSSWSMAMFMGMVLCVVTLMSRAVGSYGAVWLCIFDAWFTHGSLWVSLIGIYGYPCSTLGIDAVSQCGNVSIYGASWRLVSSVMSVYGLSVGAVNSPACELFSRCGVSTSGESGSHSGHQWAPCKA